MQNTQPLKNTNNATSSIRLKNDKISLYIIKVCFQFLNFKKFILIFKLVTKIFKRLRKIKIKKYFFNNLGAKNQTLFFTFFSNFSKPLSFFSKHYFSLSFQFSHFEEMVTYYPKRFHYSTQLYRILLPTEVDCFQGKQPCHKV